MSGNWTATDTPAVSRWTYAFSAVIAVLINNSLYLVVLTIIWQLAASRRQQMTLREALDAYEVAARAEIISRMERFPPTNLEEVAERIEEGLAEGRKSALPIIKAVGGISAFAGWERAQEQTLD